MHNPLIRAALRSSSLTISSSSTTAILSRNFSRSAIQRAKNRIYPQRIRNEDELQTLLLMSASSRTPLLTLWRTQFCTVSDEVRPILLELLERDGVGEAQGGVGFVEIETDSPDLGGVSGVALRYAVNDDPTLLAFDRQEPQLETKVKRVEDLKSREFLRRWIEIEAARQGEGGAGGSLFGMLGKWLK
jgi:thiol-disulfide isomerase/thioredoxin